MKKGKIISGIIAIVVILSSTCVFAEGKRKWNNPENEKRYKEALRHQSEAYRNESKAWGNYDRELGRAQDDVRTVRNEAIKGALKGGAPGAAWGAAKGSGKRIYERGKYYYQSRRNK